MHRKPFASSKRDVLLKLFGGALEAVDGRRRTFERLGSDWGSEPVWIAAVGKAASAMTLGAFDSLGDCIRSALVITKDGHASEELEKRAGVRVMYTAHPLPDSRSLAAGEALLEFAATVPAGGRVLALVSGGASSLCEALPAGLSEADWQRLNAWYLQSGADIVTINTVRGCLSRIKAGRWMHSLAHARVQGLAISDVPGDDPALIGSGLLASPSATAEANATLARGVAAGASSGLPALDVPDWISHILARHAQPAVSARAPTQIIARNEDAVQGACAKAMQLGLSAIAAKPRFDGDAAELGRRIAQETTAAPGSVRVYGGETTVRLPINPGVGGRSQHLALTAAQQAAGFDEFYLLAAGTDGSDGPGEAAGALIDHGTRMRGQDAGMDISRALRDFDSGSFLASSGDLIDTGPTGTNVGDIVIAWAPVRERAE